MLKDSIKVCHLVTTSGMGKSYFFDNAPSLLYEQPYIGTDGQRMRRLFVLDEPRGLIYAHCDWSTHPVKLADAVKASWKMNILDQMLKILNEQWAVSYEYCGKTLTYSEARALLEGFTKIVLVGHTYDPDEESYGIVAEPELVIRRLRHIESDHWLIASGKDNTQLLEYHKTILEAVRDGKLKGLEVTEVEGEFLIDLFESGELGRLIGGENV